MIGLNFFSNDFDSEKDYMEASKNFPVNFESIEINLNTDLRKKFEMELKVKN